MMFWLPRFLICSCASKLAPSPMASMAITEQTPNTMPRTVSSERKRCSQRLRTPNRMVRLRRVSARPPASFSRDRMGLLADIAFNAAIAKPQGAAGVARNRGVVSDQNQGLALLVEFFEQPEGFGAGSRVEISRRFVRKDCHRIVYQC